MASKKKAKKSAASKRVTVTAYVFRGDEYSDDNIFHVHETESCGDGILVAEVEIDVTSLVKPKAPIVKIKATV